jgi:hypothetical protein
VVDAVAEVRYPAIEAPEGIVTVPVKVGDAIGANKAKAVPSPVICDCARFGISAATIALKVGAPVDPFGDAKKRFVV